ncbi:hypothetical protein AgCh_037137 [Apium graveolens]
MSTRVWRVPWLPDSRDGCLITEMPIELEETTVAGLMDESGLKWDEDILQDLCNERDRELILQIPIPVQNREDNWFWLFDSNRNFSVKSGYRQLQGEIQKPHAKFWSRLWNLQLPGKVVNLVWRACRACLPTMMALATKRVSADKVCPWCLQMEETDIHVLFDYSFARVFESLSLEKCALFGLACWSIWKRRNDWVWSKVKVSVQGVKAGAMTMLQDWKNAKKNEVQNSQE